MSELKVIPSKGEQNEVRKYLEAAITDDFDEVFIIGTKDGTIRTRVSGYKDLPTKLGMIELLKSNMIYMANGD